MVSFNLLQNSLHLSGQKIGMWVEVEHVIECSVCALRAVVTAAVFKKITFPRYIQ